MDFDIRPFESKCFVSDREWQMILESGAYIKLNKCCYCIYKNYVLTFIIRESGLIDLLQKRKKPSVDYVLPALQIGMNFKQRTAVYLEEERLAKGQELDVEHFLKYAM